MEVPCVRREVAGRNFTVKPQKKLSHKLSSRFQSQRLFIKNSSIAPDSSALSISRQHSINKACVCLVVASFFSFCYVHLLPTRMHANLYASNLSTIST
jgi:hypothetical protein